MYGENLFIIPLLYQYLVHFHCSLLFAAIKDLIVQIQET